MVALSRRKKIAFSIVTTLTFFGLAELAFRLREQIYPPRHVDYGLGFNPDSRVFVDSPTMLGVKQTAREKQASFPQQRFQNPKPEGTFRIVALGGSSVHYLQPELQALASQFSNEYQDHLDQIEIINCGGFAYGSHRLVLLFREMLEYEPDLILLYTGHNEFEEVEQLQLSNLDRLTLDRAISRLAIVRFLRDMKTEHKISQLEKEHNRRVLDTTEPVSDSNFARAWSHPFTSEDVEQRMNQYEHNLRLILDSARQQSIPVIIGTVPSNLLRPYLPQEASERYEGVYELFTNSQIDEGVALGKQILVETPGRHQSSDLENEIIRRLANKYSLPLADVEKRVTETEPNHVPGQTLFDDHCHLSQTGRSVWISAYEPEIRSFLQEGH